MTPDSEKRRFYEAVRRSDKFNVNNPTAQELDEWLEDQDPSPEQIQLVNQRLAEEELLDWNDLGNTVQTDRKADIPASAAERNPRFDSETHVNTSSGRIALSDIGGTFKKHGKIYVKDVSGKILGTIEE